MSELPKANTCNHVFDVLIAFKNCLNTKIHICFALPFSITEFKLIAAGNETKNIIIFFEICHLHSPASFRVYFRSFQPIFQHKNCRQLRDLNSDRQSGRQAR